MFRMPKNHKGNMGLGTILIGVAIVVLTIILASTVLPIITSDAVTTLERQGYIVLADSEYELLAKEATAYAAVVNADAAVIAAQLAAAKVDLFNSAERFLFPEDTTTTVTLTAGNTNVWSAWTEIEDGNTVTLSSAFAANSGYLGFLYIYDHSAVDKLYAIEIAYGDDKHILARTAWHTSYQEASEIKSRRVPAGETIYYRMMCSGANGATAKVGFRYFYE